MLMDNYGAAVGYAPGYIYPVRHLVWFVEEKHTGGVRWQRRCNCQATTCTSPNTEHTYPSMDDFIRDLNYPVSSVTVMPCIKCGQTKLGMIQLPYPSKNDGEYICNDCFAAIVDAATNVLL